MAKILDNQWNVFTDGQTSDADKVSDNVYKPGGSYSSLEEINGHLDKQNLPGAADPEYWLITSDLVQDNTFTGAGMVGSTGNVDYFRKPMFQDRWRNKTAGPDELLDASSVRYRTTINTNDYFPPDNVDFVPVPGANIEFYLPYDCSLVLITWNAHFDDDGDHGTFGDGGSTRTYDLNSYKAGEYSDSTGFTRTWLRFYLDDEWVEGQERYTYPFKQRPSEDGGIVNSLYFPGGQLMQGRYWNGHHAAAVSNGTGLTKGWHSAGLRIFSNSNQARVRCRGIRYVFFR